VRAIEDAYAVLGVSAQASATEIRAAYHALALKWHPDRYPEGARRDIANRYMVRINLAYDEAMRRAGQKAVPPETPPLSRELREEARALLSINKPQAAVQALMRSACRDGEWHYWFGLSLLRLGDARRAVFHLAQAMRMRPADAECRRAYLAASEALEKQNSPWGRILRIFRGKPKHRPRVK